MNTNMFYFMDHWIWPDTSNILSFIFAKKEPKKYVINITNIILNEERKLNKNTITVPSLLLPNTLGVLDHLAQHLVVDEYLAVNI